MMPEDHAQETDDLDRLISGLTPEERAAYDDERHRAELLRRMAARRSGLSQGRVAERMGTTQSAVSDLENGKTDPYLSTLQRYARAVDARLDVQVVVDTPAGPPSPQTGTGLPLPDSLPVAEHGFGRVLKVLLRKQQVSGSQSRSQLAEETRLSPPLIDRTVNRLAAYDWVQTVGDTPGTGTVLTVNANRGQVVGISIGTRHISGVITNLQAGDAHAARVVDLPAGGPRAAVAAIRTLISELREAARRPGDIIGLGVALSGMSDKWGTIVSAPGLEACDGAWRNFRLGPDLEDATGLRTVVDNNANALALHEYLRQGVASDLAVVLIPNEGAELRCGLVYNGRLLHSPSGVGGELGNVHVGRLPQRHEGARLKDVASPDAIARRAAAADGGLDAVAASADRGDRAAIEALRTGGEAIGHVLATLASFLPPSRVVVYGRPELTRADLRESARIFTDAVSLPIDSAWFQEFGKQPELIAREYDATSGPLGAASVWISRFLHHPLQLLAARDTRREEIDESVLAR